MKWSRRWFADSLIGCIPMLESFSQQSLMEEKSGKTTKWDMIRHDCGKQTISTLTNRLESSSSSFCERVFIDAPSRKEKNNNKKYRWRHSIRVDCDRWRWKKKRIYEEFSWKTREFFFFVHRWILSIKVPLKIDLEATRTSRSTKPSTTR